MTKSKLILIIILAVLIGIQFIDLGKANPPVLSDIQTTMEVKTILTKSCYDCHSNETKWPWYSKIAPVSWLVVNDVNEGREHLNFSDWERLKTEKRVELANKIIEEIDSDEMPLGIYTPLHPGSSLDIDKKLTLKKWFKK